ncbi:DUF4783 domain-containing protein [Algoriphagus halophytocola]|uniref:DUF4783 domain-containing protein n=1 Tax=Algoriphagus halophytocola TaxID=2991499 RepID=A0ABY6MG47_9BACT|nr:MULTISPECIES: DUF4783 domain-containing protein [unclassified Algoriphagus]UZD21601.1 DUF4783 domain-containing protein [Algoriphagus sp. TR-M5]WBL42813.1 DUF4783 domain-containing protein [Algoriphagus sp. TR-M9]
MNAALGIILSIFLLSHSPSVDWVAPQSIDSIITAIESSSSSDLASYFDSSISLNVNGQQGDYSKSQAEVVLRDFFRKNPSRGFQILFRSDSNPAMSSYIGEYQSDAGPYKVIIKVSTQHSESRVYSLEFVKG